MGCCLQHKFRRISADTYSVIERHHHVHVREPPFLELRHRDQIQTIAKDFSLSNVYFQFFNLFGKDPDDDVHVQGSVRQAEPRVCQHVRVSRVGCRGDEHSRNAGELWGISTCTSNYIKILHLPSTTRCSVYTLCPSPFDCPEMWRGARSSDQRRSFGPEQRGSAGC
jgi:hypothetical protein